MLLLHSLLLRGFSYEVTRGLASLVRFATLPNKTLKVINTIQQSSQSPALSLQPAICLRLFHQMEMSAACDVASLCQ